MRNLHLCKHIPAVISGVMLCAAVFTLVSCDDLINDIKNLAVPEEFDVVTPSDPSTFEFPLGSVSMDLDSYFNLSDYLSADAIKKTIGSSNSSLSVLDYKPSTSEPASSDASKLDEIDYGTTQTYMVDYTLDPIDIDISSYLSTDMLSGALADTDIGSHSFTVPSLSDDQKTISKAIDIPDITDTVLNKIQINNSFDPITVYEAGLPQSNPAVYTYEITVSLTDNFDTANFRGGSLNVTFTPSASPSSGFYFGIAAALSRSDGTAITASSGTTNIAQSTATTISLPLTGKTIVPSMKVALTGTYYGGSLGTTDTYAISVALSNDIDIDHVTGVTISADDIGKSIDIDQTVSLSSTSSAFVSATVGTGSIELQLSYPSVTVDGTKELWSGVVCTPVLALGGGLSTTESFGAQSDEGSTYLMHRKISLDGATLTPKDITMTGSFAISLENATIYFPESSGSITADLTGTVDLSSLTSATVNMGSDFDTTYSTSYTLPSAVTSLVKRIAGVKVTLSGTFTNTLPSGNDISISVLSTDLGIVASAGSTDPLKITVASGSTEAQPVSAVGQSADIDVSTNSTLDIDVSLALPGQTTSGNNVYITVSNIQFGSTYSISGSIGAAVDWTSVTVDTSNYAQTGTIDTGLSISDIFSSMQSALNNQIDLSSLQVLSLPVYLYVSLPKKTDGTALLNGLSLNGVVYGTYKDASGTAQTPVYLLGSAGTLADDTSDDVSASVSSVNTFTPSSNTTNSVYTAWLPAASYSTNAFTTIVNAHGNDLSLSYKLTAGAGNELTLSKSDIESAASAGSSAINVSVVALIPLALNITNDLTVDVLKVAGLSDNDLFSRTSATDSDSVTTALGVLKSAGITYTIADNATSKMLDGLNLSVQFVSNTSSSWKKTIDVTSSSKQELSLTSAEIKSMLETYKFVPSLNITIGATTASDPLRILRDSSDTHKVGLSAAVKIVTNGSQTVTVWSKN